MYISKKPKHQSQFESREVLSLWVYIFTQIWEEPLEFVERWHYPPRTVAPIGKTVQTAVATADEGTFVGCSIYLTYEGLSDLYAAPGLITSDAQRKPL